MSAEYWKMWSDVGGNIPEHWSFVRFEDLLQNSKSITVGVMYPGSHDPSGVPLIKVSDVKNGAILGKPEFCITKEVDHEYRRTRLSGKELLITLVGNPGDCVIVDDSMAGWNAARALAVVRLKDPELRPWLRYVLLSKPAKHLIDARLNTTVQKTLNLKDIKNLPIPIAPPQERLFVEKVGGSIEEKVNLNSEINQTLEQMAQAIFKSWFVDFDPVRAKIDVLEAGGSEEDSLLAAMQVISGKDADQLGRFQTEQPEPYAELKATAELFPSAMQDSELGEVPQGWEVGKLGELLLFNPRRTLKKGTVAPYLDMKNVPTSGHLAEEVILREMASGTKFINGDTLLARITPCLENGKTAYVDFLRQDQVGWGSTEYIVIRPHDGYPESIGYLIARDANFRQLAIQSMTGTSGRQRANAKALVDLPWVIYPQDVANEFGKIANVYLKLAKSYGDESKSLSQIRDTLLPKLLSGELTLEPNEGNKVATA